MKEFGENRVVAVFSGCDEVAEEAEREAAEAPGGWRAVEGAVDVAEEGLSKGSPVDEVEELFALDGPGREGIEFGGDVASEVGQGHAEGPGVTEILEAVCTCVANEVGEVDWRVGWLEVFVGEVVVRSFGDECEFAGEHLRVKGSTREACFEVEGGAYDDFGHRAGVGDELPGLGLELASGEDHEFSEGLAEVPAGVAVVADEGDAVGCEEFSAEAKEAVADGFFDPGVDAVGDDVIEGAKIGAGVHDVEDFEPDVGEAEAGGHGASELDLAGGVVDAETGSTGEAGGDGVEVLADGRADFEDAGAGGRWGFEAEEAAEGSEAPRVRRFDGGAFVGDGVVTDDRHVGFQFRAGEKRGASGGVWGEILVLTIGTGAERVRGDGSFELPRCVLGRRCGGCCARAPVRVAVGAVRRVL